MRFTEDFGYSWKTLKIIDVAPLQRGFDLPEKDLKLGIYPVVYSNGIKNYHNQYKAIAPGIVTGRSGTIGKFTYIDNGGYWPHNTSLWVTDFKSNYPKFVYYLFQFVNFNNYSSGSGVPTLNRNDIHDRKVSIPPLNEQIKIATFLDLIERRIDTQIKIIEDFELLKKEISNQIFSVLHKFPTGIVEEYIYYEQPQKYIVNSSEYVKKNKHTIPVLTANQAFILGYTNEINGIYDKGACIIIDDFTLDCKYVDFDFKIKSSAIKILKGNDTMLTKFFYEYLKFLNLSTEEHKRHYISEVSKLPINVPPLSQQNLIVNKLDLLSQKIENEKAILNLYKEQKNYLLNNMFI